MSLEARLDRLHERVTASAWARGLTAVVRGMLAVGYFLSGLTKALGARFTQMPVETPVGHFFDAMYRTGFYYRFLGAAQVLAALLLLWPRTATLGALLYLPIALNIFLVTVSVGFQGTPFVTGMMLLGAVYLVCWDYPRWKGVVFEPVPRSAQPASSEVSGALTLAVAFGVQGMLGVLAGLGTRRIRLEFVALLALGVGILLYQRWRGVRYAGRRP